MDNNFLIAFLLTLFAGLATGIGSLIGLVAKKTNKTFLSLALGFSAGVMIFVSFIEIYPKAHDLIASKSDNAQLITLLAFFTGILVIGVIDKLIPKETNPHEVRGVEELNDPNIKNKKLLKMGILTALAVGIHNFPEGLATFMSALTDPSLGIPIAIAIAIHNIPEGLAISVPIYYATGSRIKAFLYSFLSGLSEPIGAIIGYLILRPFLDDALIGIVFAAVAGIMVFISLDELLPTAKEYGKHHTAIYGVVSGMLVMGISLVLLG